MRIYLDNCCFNRPYDSQSQIRIKLETEAKLHIQDLVKEGSVELASSYVLLYENSKNPYSSRKDTIKSLAIYQLVVDIYKFPKLRCLGLLMALA